MSDLLPILIQETGLSEAALRRIAFTAPTRYKTFRIAKRREGEKRLIAQPAREVKLLQRTVVEHFLSKLPVHSAATAYRHGMSIRDNATPHAGDGPIKKYDFKEFFPSIRARDWLRYCDRHRLLLDPDDRWLSTQLLFHRESGSVVFKLAIGAPSSPALSNILMYDFDSEISKLAAKDKVTYTRYADDLTFSAKRTGYLNHVDEIVKASIKKSGIDHLRLNDEKTVVATRKFRRQITGLVLSNDGRVTIGREKKRKIRAALHQESLKLLNPQQRSELCGTLAYINSVEPDFIDRLKRIFGERLIEDLKSDARTSTNIAGGLGDLGDVP